MDYIYVWLTIRTENVEKTAEKSVTISWSTVAEVISLEIFLKNVARMK